MSELINVAIMSFIKRQAEIAFNTSNILAGVLDVKEDHAYAQLKQDEVAKTEKALTKVLSVHAGERRLAAILSIAIKAAAGDLK